MPLIERSVQPGECALRGISGCKSTCCVAETFEQPASALRAAQRARCTLSPLLAVGGEAVACSNDSRKRRLWATYSGVLPGSCCAVFRCGLLQAGWPWLRRRD